MYDDVNARRKKAILVIVAAFVLVIGIFSIPILADLFHKNPFGEEIKIDNFSEYYKSVTRERRDAVYHALYGIVADNTENNESIPKSGALIRKDTAATDYDETDKVYDSSFVVDIPAIQQSYRVNFEWVANDRIKMSGDSMLITCVRPSEVIYENFVCSDSLTKQEQEKNELYARFPIMQVLPIRVEYYEGGYGKYIRYDIEGDLSYNNGEHSFKIIIKDYTSDNYEAALQKIAEAGYKASDYEIEYQDYNMYPSPYAE